MTLLLALCLLAADPAEIQKRIRENDLAWLKTAAQDPTFLATKDARKNTPLIWAAAQGSPETVIWLLDLGANPNEANSLGITPLIAAATEPAKVKALLAKGADVKAKSQIGQNALTIAAGSPRASDSVFFLLKAGASPNEPGARGTTPLLSALGNACAVVNARLLLAAGADPKIVDGAGFGTVHSAASCPVNLIKDLIAHGAKVNLQNTFGGSVKKGEIALKGISPLMLAAAHREPAMIQLLLDSGADVNAADVRQMTPLLYAVSSEDQNPAVIKLLLAKGADPKHKDIHGEDSIAWARKFNHPAVLALLGVKPEPPAATQPTAKGPGPQAALTLLEQANEQFFKESGCGGCHHSTLLSLAASRASTAGLKVDPALVEARAARLKGMLAAFSTTLMQLVPLPGDIDSALYTLIEAKGLGLARTPEMEILSRYIWARQLPDGSFTQRGISRSPIEESDIHRTALALWLLPEYSDAAAKTNYAPRLKEAAQWLEAQPARNVDELGMKLLGLRWGHASQDSIAKAAKALAAAQLPNGSFSGNKHMPGDPYSTGFALFALREGARRPATDPAIVKAARWLRAEQRPDASWYQKSRAPKFQPYFESGFPHGQDQWISAAATAWAVIGISEAGGQ